LRRKRGVRAACRNSEARGIPLFFVRSQSTGKGRQWSGRADSNRGPPAPKAGGLLKLTLLLSTLVLKQNNLVVIQACGWLCATVLLCLLGGHKSWHNLRDRNNPPHVTVVGLEGRSFGPKLAPAFTRKSMVSERRRMWGARTGDRLGFLKQVQFCFRRMPGRSAGESETSEAQTPKPPC
jgi:hypothetical protein